MKTRKTIVILSIFIGLIPLYAGVFGVGRLEPWTGLVESLICQGDEELVRVKSVGREGGTTTNHVCQAPTGQARTVTGLVLLVTLIATVILMTVLAVLTLRLIKHLRGRPPLRETYPGLAAALLVLRNAAIAAGVFACFFLIFAPFFATKNPTWRALADDVVCEPGEELVREEEVRPNRHGERTTYIEHYCRDAEGRMRSVNGQEMLFALAFSGGLFVGLTLLIALLTWWGGHLYRTATPGQQRAMGNLVRGLVGGLLVGALLGGGLYLLVTQFWDPTTFGPWADRLEGSLCQSDETFVRVGELNPTRYYCVDIEGYKRIVSPDVKAQRGRLAEIAAIGLMLVVVPLNVVWQFHRPPPTIPEVVIWD